MTPSCHQSMSRVTYPLGQDALHKRAVAFLLAGIQEEALGTVVELVDEACSQPC